MAEMENSLDSIVSPHFVPLLQDGAISFEAVFLKTVNLVDAD